mmetsp:Transcript_94390/g.303442  ORF Transcript_94390/g.303442 Transcript_94390/m.303442 type:complete len:275 (-) Transcript_94390:510-1334(-)
MSHGRTPLALPVVGCSLRRPPAVALRRRRRPVRHRVRVGRRVTTMTTLTVRPSSTPRAPCDQLASEMEAFTATGLVGSRVERRRQVARMHPRSRLGIRIRGNPRSMMIQLLRSRRRAAVARRPPRAAQMSLQSVPPMGLPARRAVHRHLVERTLAATVRLGICIHSHQRSPTIQVLRSPRRSAAASRPPRSVQMKSRSVRPTGLPVSRVVHRRQVARTLAITGRLGTCIGSTLQTGGERCTSSTSSPLHPHPGLSQSLRIWHRVAAATRPPRST